MLFFLLNLTRAFLPKDIKAVIEGSDFVLNIYEFFQWRKSNSYSSIVNEFEFELSDQRLKPLGIKYDSTFANVFSIMITIFLMIFVSTFIYLTKILFKRLKERNKWSCLSKVLFWISDRLSRILILSYFIRNFLEMLQFIMISTIYEIYKNNTTSVYRSISLSFSYLIILMFLLIFIFIQYLTFSSYKLNEGEHNKLEEFFRGIKQNKRHKFYITMLLIRRIVFIILLITWVFIPSIILIVILSIFQAAYVIYLTWLRPYIEIKGNLIEILNELYFSILLIALSILNTESDWTSVKTALYMWTLVSNTLLIFIIVLGKFL